MKGLLNIIFLFQIALSNNTILPQPLLFSEEAIEIKIYDGYTIVNGDYTFKNKSKNELTRALFYPFPVNLTSSYPDSIFVFVQDNKAISFTRSSTGIHFSIKVLPDSETTIKVSYRQKLTSEEMKYILTSTQSWKQPLEKAEYKILLTKKFELTNLSLKPDKKDSNSTYNIYYITKENFMPETDLIVKWARRGK